jgi:hypothetical protein
VNPTLQDPRLDRLRTNLGAILARIRAAEQRSGREEGSCRLLPVVKRIPNAAVRALRALGQDQLAENQVAAFLKRPASLRDGCRWHLIGHLQTNKAAKARRSFDVFHALDTPRLAEQLGKLEAAQPWSIYLQVNVAGESQKYGCALGALDELARATADRQAFAIQGLMTMAPLGDSPEAARPHFRRLRELSHSLRTSGLLPEGANGLSMGMSMDFEVAVEEGATQVRVGRSLFEGVDYPEDPP